MITITGRTFEHRDLLRSLGGRFDQDARHWLFDTLRPGDLDRLRALVGCMVTVTDDPPPPTISFDFTALAPRTERVGSCTLYGDDPTYHNAFADQNPAAFFGFSSLGKFVDWIERNRHERTGWEGGNEAFSGTASMSEAIRLARGGWQEGLERAQEAAERLAVDNPRVRRRRASVAGGTVNVGRMLSGDPAHMIHRPRQPGRKVVTFFVEAGCYARIKPASMIARAALIGATIDIMENAGYSCSIVAVDTSLDINTPMYQLAVQLKEAGERLNLADLMFALGHPSFLRRFSFAACSAVPETREIWWSQGSPSNAFDDNHRCTLSQFYVPVLERNATTDDPLELLSDVVPDGLPVEIGKER